MTTTLPASRRATPPPVWPGGPRRIWAWPAAAVGVAALTVVAAVARMGAAPPRASRVQGADRYATAAAVAMTTFRQTNTVVLVRADQPTDALAALYLAGTERAALLFSGPAGLSDATVNALITLAPHQALIVGDDTAVPLNVDVRLAQLQITATRLAAPTRYGTADLIAQTAGTPASFATLGPTAIVIDDADAAGYTPAGALADGAHYPVLYTNDGTLLPETAAALIEAHIRHVILLGHAAAAAPSLKRLGITTQVATTREGPAASTDLAAFETYALGWSADKVVLARGDAFSDALAADQLAGTTHTPLVLTQSTSTLGDLTGTYLQIRAPIARLDIIGDPTAITPSAEDVAVRAGRCCVTR